MKLLLESITYKNLSGSPATGTRTIAFRVSDKGMNSMEVNRSIEVLLVNDAPVFVIDRATITVNEDFTTPERIVVTADMMPMDERGQVVTYNIIPPTIPFANIVINDATGEITVTAIPDASGTQNFIIRAMDDGETMHEGIDTFLLDFTLTVNSVNDAPVFVIDRATITVNEDFTTPERIVVTADMMPMDERGQIVTYNIIPPTIPFANIVINDATGEITVTAIPDASGTQNFIIRAMDDGETMHEGIDTFLLDFTLTVNSVNDAPVFVIDRRATITVNEDFTTPERIVVTADMMPMDERGQVVTYNIIPPTIPFANIVINDATGEITVTAIPDASGTQNFIIRAMDDGETMHEGIDTFLLDFTLTVDPVNDAPEIEIPLPPVTVTTDEDMDISLSGVRIVDVDLDTQIVSITINNGVLTLSSFTGLTFSSGDGLVDSYIAFSGAPSDINSAFNDMVFSPEKDFNGNAFIRIETNDRNMEMDDEILEMSIVSINDAPRLSSIERVPVDYTVCNSESIISSLINIVDVDNTESTGAIIEIVNGYNSDEDSLVFMNSASITSTWNDIDGRLVLTGSTLLSNYIIALRSVKYEHTNPLGTNIHRSIEVGFRVHDAVDTSLVIFREISLNDIPPIVDAGNDMTICSEGNIILGGFPSVINGSPTPYTYIW